MVGRKGHLLSFWKCMCFILSAITAVRHPGAKVGPWGTRNTPLHPALSGLHIRGRMQGGPVVARLESLLFLPDWSGGVLRRWIQGDLGPWSLVLREGVALCWAWAPSILSTFLSLRLRGGRHWFGCLLSRHRSGATGGSRRAGAFREEVSHRFRRLLSLREAFCKALHSWSKQAAWRDRSIEKGNFVRLFYLRHREPEVAL